MIIQHAVWLYLSFTTSYRHVEELLAERGLSSKIVQFCTAGSRTHRWREMDSNFESLSAESTSYRRQQHRRDGRDAAGEIAMALIMEH